MSGSGLMQLVANGAQDVYLTGKPEITLFKSSYRRHTNFSLEDLEISFNSTPRFGNKAVVQIVRSGDLVSDIALLVRLESLRPSREYGARVGWVKRLGHAMIESVELTIGSVRIDKLYGIWLDIFYELTADNIEKREAYNVLIGNVPELTDYNSAVKPQYTIYVPLRFWFNRDVGLALPLIALQYHEVRLEFEFRPADRLVVANDAFRCHDMRQVQMRDASLLVRYIFLDKEERAKFARYAHEYLIEQVQYSGAEQANERIKRYRLDFNHPVKYLVWAMRRGAFVCGKRFPFYTNNENWESQLVNASTKIMRESIALVRTTNNSSSSSESSDCYGAPGENTPDDGSWEVFCPGKNGTTENGKVVVFNYNNEKSLWINTNSLVLGCDYSVTGKIHAVVIVPQDANSRRDVQIIVTSTDLTIRDLSFPTDEFNDTRFMPDDPHVFMYSNFGLLINGTVNPVKNAVIRFNGNDRFKVRDGEYFNAYLPWIHFGVSPAPGINVYSFALTPMLHQPSGTANLSRIDNVELIVEFWDGTNTCGCDKRGAKLPVICVTDSNNIFYIFGVNYNISRVLSGLFGNAYA